MKVSTFSALGLSERLLQALAGANYHTPTPIQARAIPPLLRGRDVLGIAQTGTGKTAAFVLPLLEHLDQNRRHPLPHSTRALILAPTRELAIQISDSITTYGRHSRVRQAVVMGGVSQRAQVRAIERGVDILIATPGRLIDLVGQRQVDLGRATYLVLDEADRMLDMGFVREVRRLTALLPKTRQSILFSATMPREMAQLANEILRDPIRVEVATEPVPVDRIDQLVHHTDNRSKGKLLARLLADPMCSRVLVFTRTKRGADRVTKQLGSIGVRAIAMHGDKSQASREIALDSFRKGRCRVLVATDIVSRGIDVDDVSHVINYELPRDPECYVHRIGRTARAGARGTAISFCDPSERKQLQDIERLIEKRLTVISNTSKRGNQEPVKSKHTHRLDRTPAPSRVINRKRNGQPGFKTRQRAA